MVSTRACHKSFGNSDRAGRPGRSRQDGFETQNAQRKLYLCEFYSRDLLCSQR